MFLLRKFIGIRFSGALDLHRTGEVRLNEESCKAKQADAKNTSFGME